VTTYAIVFKGELRDGFIREAVMAAFKERANLSETQIEQVFSGRKVTLKKGLDREGAKQFARDLRAIGMRIIAAGEGGTTSPPQTPPPGTHCIRFAGQVIEGFDAHAVKLMAAKRLKFSEQQADLLFSGKEVTMKRGLGEDKARHYADTLRRLGMDVQVDPPLAPPPEADTPMDAAEASLLQTQLAPAMPYNFEETFHSSSTLEMLRPADVSNEPMEGIHPALLAAAEAPSIGTATHARQQLDTVVNHDLAATYADALNEPPDPEIEALRAAHDGPIASEDDIPPAPQTIAAGFDITPEPPMPASAVRSPFDPPSEPPPPAPPTEMAPLEEAVPAPAVSLPPAAVRGRATASLMPSDADPELEAIQRTAEEKRKWIVAAVFVVLVAAIAVFALL